jgi:serine/threonine protein kinase
VTRYELLDRIGVGGMAEIFRGKAVAAGGFEKPVAIKRILPHLSQDRRFVELLIAEAKVLSLLKHRNIVQIFDVGLGDDGQYFLVMEYVDGKDIGAIQRALENKRRRLPFDLALHIGAEICEALEHAHTQRGPDGKPMALVHRDVSPSNVLLSRSGEVKLTDFGIAKRAESDATQGGAVRGKFAYISPEQAKNEPLDPRSDVFSVGILIWELICNRRLFSGLDDLAALRAVRDPVVPRPSEVDSRLPPEIDQILMTALAKDKTRRWSGCGALGQKLRSLRYSLEVTVGDPATELAKIIDSTEEVERESKQMMAVPDSSPRRSLGRTGFDDGPSEATVIRINTAEAFSARDDNSISQARMVVDHFEEEQTRQATLTGDQLRLLRGDSRASVEMTAEKPSLARLRPSDHDDEEPTRAHSPIDAKELAGYERPLDTPTDDTRLVAPRDRRTPAPLPGVRPPPKRPGTVPPPVPSQTGSRARGPTPGPPVSSQKPIPATMQMTPAPMPAVVAPANTANQSQPLPPQLSANSSQPMPPQIATPLPYGGPPALPFGGAARPGAPFDPNASQNQPFNPNASQNQPFNPNASQNQSFNQHSAPLGGAAPFNPNASQNQPYYPPQPAGSYPGWGPPIASQHGPRDATPTAQDSFDGRPMYPQRGSMPEVAGFSREPKKGLQPWVLVVGAIVMALLAFLITRAAIG